MEFLCNYVGSFLLILTLVFDIANCLPRALRYDTETLDVVIGGTAEFECVITGKSPDTSFKWHINFNNRDQVIYEEAGNSRVFNNQLFGSSSDRGQYQLNVGIQPGATVQESVYTLKLTITGVTKNDAGSFACAYNFPHSTPITLHIPVSLNVLYPPDVGYPICTSQLREVSNPQFPGEVLIGLTCQSQGGNPTATLSWHEESGEPLSDSGEIWFERNRNSDKGKRYTCRASSVAIQNGYRECSLIPINDDPSPITLPPAPPNPQPQPDLQLPLGVPSCSYDLQEIENQPDTMILFLNCEWSGGSPAATLKWQDSRSISIGQGGVSSVFFSRQTEQTDYTCVATHPATSYTFECKVTPVLPALPTTRPPTITPRLLIPPASRYPRCSYSFLTMSSPFYVQLTCTSEGGTPPADLAWYDQNGNLLPSGAQSQVLINFIPSPNQYFTCRATSPSITTNRACTISPEPPLVPTTRAPTTTPRLLIPPAPQYPECSYSFLTTTSPFIVKLICTSVGGTPPAQLAWYDTDNILVHNGPEYAVNFIPDQDFTCRATGPAINTNRQCTIRPELPHVPTTEPPMVAPNKPACSFQVISNDPSSTTALIYLSCASSGGNPPATVQWFDNNGNPIPSSQSLSSVSVQQSVMRGVSYSFTCRAYSPVAMVDPCESTVHVPLIQQPPPITDVAVVPPDDVQCEYQIKSYEELDHKARIMLICESVGGNPTPNLVWFEHTHSGSIGWINNDGPSVEVYVTLDEHFTFECRATTSGISENRNCFVSAMINVPEASTQKVTTKIQTTQSATEQPRKMTSSSVLQTRKQTQTVNDSNDIDTHSSTTIKLEIRPTPSTTNDVMAVVGISIGVVILLIIIILFVGCILRGVVRKNVDKYSDSRRFTNPTSNSMMSNHSGDIQFNQRRRMSSLNESIEPRSRMSSINEPIINPFTPPQSPTHIVNPIFQNHQGNGEVDHPYFSTVEDMNMKNSHPSGRPKMHAYEDMPDLNPPPPKYDTNYEYVVPTVNGSQHIYESS